MLFLSLEERSNLKKSIQQKRTALGLIMIHAKTRPKLSSAFCMPRIPFAFESEWPNGNSPNYHSAVSEKSVEWPFDRLYPNLTNGNSTTVLSLNYHSAIQTQTQTQTESEVFGKHT